jgi:hypothetical protein
MHFCHGFLPHELTNLYHAVDIDRTVNLSL